VAAPEKLNLFERKSRASRQARAGVRHGSGLRQPARACSASHEYGRSRNARQSTHLFLLESSTRFLWKIGAFERYQLRRIK